MVRPGARNQVIIPAHHCGPSGQVDVFQVHEHCFVENLVAEWLRLQEVAGNDGGGGVDTKNFFRTLLNLVVIPPAALCRLAVASNINMSRIYYSMIVIIKGCAL